MQVHTVNNNSQTSNCQYSLFSKKSLIIRIMCNSGWRAVPFNPDKRNSTVLPDESAGFVLSCSAFGVV
jgi:hypothetical protein